jgi:hypothetical protein
MSLIVTTFNVWLWMYGLGALFGGYSLEWWAFSGNNGSLTRYFAFLAIPIVCCIQSINMINALANGSWAKKIENVNATQIFICKILYSYCAIGFLLIFIYSIKLFLSL